MESFVVGLFWGYNNNQSIEPEGFACFLLQKNTDNCCAQDNKLTWMSTAENLLSKIIN